MVFFGDTGLALEFKLINVAGLDGSLMGRISRLRKTSPERSNLAFTSRTHLQCKCANTILYIIIEVLKEEEAPIGHQGEVPLGAWPESRIFGDEFHTVPGRVLQPRAHE